MLKSSLSLITYLRVIVIISFILCLINSYFFSLLVDGTPDSGRVEDELVVVLYCKQDDVEIQS